MKIKIKTITIQDEPNDYKYIFGTILGAAIGISPYLIIIQLFPLIILSLPFLVITYMLSREEEF